MSANCLYYINSGAMSPETAAAVWCAAAAAAQKLAELRQGIFEAAALGANPAAIYEILLQTYLFAGFPAAIEGLSVFASALRERGVEFAPPPAEDYDAAVFAERGERLCGIIYGDVFKKMSASLGELSPDLYSRMIIEGYGRTLSRDGLSLKTRELAIAGTLATLGWQRQLFSHIRGSVNVGASYDEALHAVKICSCFAPDRLEDALKTFDRACKK